MKKILISLLILSALMFTACGKENEDDDQEDGWTRDLGSRSIVLVDNFEHGAGYQATFNPAELFNGEKVTKGTEYTLQITFKASRDLEGLLLAGLVDQNPASSQPNPYWTELAYTQGPEVIKGVTLDDEAIKIGDAADVARSVQFAGLDKDTLIKANEDITAEFKWTALRDSSGTQATFNSIYFQTRGVGKTGTANSGVKGSVTLNFTKFIFIKKAGTGNDAEDSVCECPEGSKHFEDEGCCGADDCNCTLILRPALSFKINSPYAGVDWSMWKQYRAGLHIHTNSSDGSNNITTMVNTYYSLGYDILAITDHNYLGQPYTSTWTENRNTARGDTPMTQERYDEVTTGIDREGRGMTAIPNTSEMAAYPDEINTYWWTGAPAGNNWSQTQTLNAVQAAGGIASINHPGRATGGMAATLGGFYQSMNRTNYMRYVGYFRNYSCLTSMEIINRQDGDTYHDRVLWDNILKVLAPEGRNVFGRADDDAHSSSSGNVGVGWNMFVMPENTEANVRSAMENGNFYAVARNAHREGVNLGTGASAGTAPAITNIVITNDESIDAAITITVQYANKVDFITERQGPLGYYNIVHTINRPTVTAATEAWEATIELKSAKNARNEIVGSFIRCNIVGAGGIAFSQPFLIERELDMNAVLE